jgi:hypothetical protein
MPGQIERFGYIQGKPETYSPALKKQEKYFKSINDIFKGIDLDILKKIPLHLRCYFLYLMGRTDVLTEEILTDTEKKYLFSVANKYGIKKGFTYPLWKSIGAGNLPTAITPERAEKEKSTTSGSILNPELSGVFMYTLGQVPKQNITALNNNTILVNDNYDMNSFSTSKEKIMTDLAISLERLITGKGTFYSVIRRFASLRELSGYKGYPIKFTVTP